MEEDKKIEILSLSWRDIRSQKAGGAEVHTHEMLKRLDKCKYRIVHLSPRIKDKPKHENIDGVNYIRRGNVFTVILYAFFYYYRKRKSINFVIDQCNTHRFFTPLWVDKNKRIFYIHQLTREIWDINAKFPLNNIGKIMENFMLKLNRHDRTITVSHDTEKELRELGFDNDIVIIHNGVSFEPWSRDNWAEKNSSPRFVFVGRYSPYKGINVAVEAVARLGKLYPNINLCILGKKDDEFIREYIEPICEKYGITAGDSDVSELISSNNESFNISYLGYVSEDNKLKILSTANALLFPSIREGWGIPITEAACVGTPSIVYNSPGLYEAVDNGRAGYVCKTNSVEGLYEQMLDVCENHSNYAEVRENAYIFSKQFRWDSIGHEVNDFFDFLVK